MSARPARTGGPAWLLLGAMAGALVAARPGVAALCLGVAVLGAVAARAPWPSQRWGSFVAAGAGIAWLLNLFLVAGHPLDGLALGPWRATREGLALGGLVALRLAGAATALHGLRSAWPGERAADEVARLLAPLE
ncbi:MAG TPA: energy-coupling factor transporter transmembrane component T, partial [Candidatus Eisenbacteria bacterium]